METIQHDLWIRRTILLCRCAGINNYTEIYLLEYLII
jgi:hypothetical protein